MTTSAYRLLLFLWAASVSSLAAREPTSQDYDVWYAVLMPHCGPRANYVWHLVEPTSVFDRGETNLALDFFPEARPVHEMWALPLAKLDFDKLRLAQNRANSRFPFIPIVKLLDAATLGKATGKSLKPNWLVSPKLLPGASSIYRLSWPAYREDGRAAFLICAVCTEWWGSVIKYEVNKDPIDGTWRLGRSARRDFTHWEDSKLFNDD